MKKFLNKKLNTLVKSTFNSMIKCCVFLFGLLLMLLVSNTSKVEAGSMTLCGDYTTSLSVKICSINIAAPVGASSGGGYHVEYALDSVYIFSNESHDASVFSGISDPFGVLNYLGGASDATTHWLSEYTTKKYVYGVISGSAPDSNVTGTGAMTTTALMNTNIYSVGISKAINDAVNAVNGTLRIGYINICVYNGSPYSGERNYHTDYACAGLSGPTLSQLPQDTTPPSFGVTYLINPNTVDDDATGARWNYTNSYTNTLVLEAGDCSYVNLYLNAIDIDPFAVLNCTKYSGGVYYWDGGNITLPNSISEGTNHIFARAYDDAENYAEAEIIFVFDTTTPVVEEFYLMDEGWNNTLDVATSLDNYFSFSITDSKPYYVKIYAGNDYDEGLIYEAGGDGSIITSVTDTNYSIINDQFTLLNEHTHYLFITIIDWAGNEETSEITVSYGSAPVIEAFSVKGNSSAVSGYTNTTSVTVTVMMEMGKAYEYELTDKVGSTTKTILSDEGYLSTTSFTVTLQSTNGKHTLTFTVINSVGSDSTTHTITLDTVAPTISTFTVTGNSTAICNTDECYTNTTSLNMSITASDTNSMYYAVSNTNKSTYTTTKPTSATLSSSTNGSKSLTLSVKDYAGNITTKTVSITLDTVAPVVSTLSLGTGNGFINSSIYQDEDGSVVPFTFDMAEKDEYRFSAVIVTSAGYMDDMSYGTAASEFKTKSQTITASHGLSQGTATITLTVKDNAGNQATKTASATVDTIAPTISTFALTDYDNAALSGYTNDATIKTSISATDTNGIRYYSISGTSTSNVTTAPTTLTLSSTTQGTKALTLTVEDNAGNKYTKTASIILDTVKPTISTFTVTGNSAAVCNSDECYTNDTSIKTSISATDTNGIRYYSISGTSTSNVTTAPTTLTLSSTTQGTKTLTLTVEDNAGNKFTAEASIILDTIAPEISTLSAGTGNGFADASVYEDEDVAVVPFTFTMKEKDEYSFSARIESSTGYEDETGYGSYSEIKTKSYSISITHLSEGEAIITLTVKDKAGNTHTKTAVVIVDRTAPVLALGGINVISTGTVAVDTEYYVTVTDKYIIDPIYGTGLVSIKGDLTADELAYYELNSDLKGSNHTVPYTTSNMTYYFYGLYTEDQIQDPAGNIASYDGEFEDVSTGDMWYYKKFTLNVTGSNHTNNNEEKHGGFIGSDSFDLPSIVAPEPDVVDGNYYNYQISNNKTLIVVQVEHETNCTSVGKLITAYGMALANDNTTSCASTIVESIVKYNNLYESVKVVVINTAPRLNASNAGSSLVVNKGEEVSNIGLSFTSVDGEQLQVDTLITLNGVKVKEIDTNIPGVYNIRQIAVDSKGRSNRIDKQIIVLDDESTQEVVITEEEIEVVEEVLVPVVNNTKNVETSNNQASNKLVEEVPQVEMHIEKKIKVKGYQKRKEIRRTKKEKFSFKLFSKYFFKIYDG